MSLAATTYTVVRGDTLTAIAKKFNTTVSNLVKLNNIKDPDYIVVGQVLKITGSYEPEPATKSNAVSVTVFGVQSNTDRTLYIAWTWTKSNTKEYQVQWEYDSGDGLWFIENVETVNIKQAVHSAPANAQRVRVKVKPVSTTRKVNGKDTAYWSGTWSSVKVHSFVDLPTDCPVPEVKLDGLKLTASVSNVPTPASIVQFDVTQDNTKSIKMVKVNLVTSVASYTCDITAGSTYKVRARCIYRDQYGHWSNYSNNVETAPSVPGKFTKCEARTNTSIFLEWPKVNNAKTYDIEYATEKRAFNGSDQTTTINSITTTQYEKGGLETGKEYFFRVRAVNDHGTSGWSEISSCKIGKGPAAPTTWSSTTTAITGEVVNLYWVHNSADSSSQTYAELELNINGTTTVHEIKKPTAEDEKDKTSVYKFDTKSYVEGTKIEWRVRTSGVQERLYGEWSIQRSIDIYAPPVLAMNVTDSSGSIIDTLESFPFYIAATAGPDTQTPIGYHVTIVPTASYDTVDELGNRKTVTAGETVYSKYYDISTPLMLEMSANLVDLENNVTYVVKVTVSMNSGLNTTSEQDFTVSWTDIEYEPNAEISIDEETYTASIRPYCEDENGVLIDGVVLSVYRREFDGSFTKIISDIPNSHSTFVTDPHPSLDYARYRVVAKSTATGAVSHYDLPGYPVGGKAVIIQWEEAWSSFESTNEDPLAQPPWSGSLLKLPYNIDISDSNKQDVALIEYAGRKRPVSYYGTQLGETSNWNVVIDKSDKETLYQLRRLAVWTGDVYVREPSGTGYWANIAVSFSQKHLDVTIPVTINVTRVEGGV